MRDDEEMLRLMRSINRRLALLAGAKEREVRRRLIAEVLRTPARVKMYDAIDGKTGSPELAAKAGAKERTAQQLIQDLRDLGLVKVAAQTTGRGFAVEKDDDAIVQWHLQAAGKEADEAEPPTGT